jgi:Protein of unknown function (DUF3108)
VLRRRFLLGFGLSALVHLFAGASTTLGWLNLMPWFGKPEEKPPAIVLSARLAAAPAVMAAPTSAPAPAATPAPAAKPVTPRKREVRAVPVVAEAPDAANAKTETAASKPEAIPPGPAIEPAPVREEPPAPPPPPPKVAKTSPFPERARIEFEMTLESNNYKVWAAQTWEQKDGRYRVVLTAEAKALFFSLGKLTMESAGVITADGLRPERYVDERNQRRTVVSFAANEKSAFIEEPNGNKKTVQLIGQAADVMSLTYDLAFNPDLNIGAPFTLSNRDNVEEIRLVEKRDESLVTDSATLATKFFDFKRTNGSGGMQVWLAVDRQWLPAKIRILGRDGAVTMMATKFEINPPPAP